VRKGKWENYESKEILKKKYEEIIRGCIRKINTFLTMLEM
jgi:hypothetical protein